MKNVLIISYAFPPMSVAGTFRPMKFVKYLGRYGWKPSVIAVDGRDDIPRDETLLKQLPDDLDIIRTKAWGPSNLRIISNDDFRNLQDGRQSNVLARKYLRARRDIANFLNNSISIPDPLIYWVPSVISAGIKAYRSEPYDAVFTTSPPHSVHFAGLFLSRYLHVPWIADFRDPWVDNVYFKHIKGALRRPLETWLEKIIIKKADYVIANTGPNRDKLIERYGSSIPDSRVVAITNGFDKEFIDSIEPQANEKFTICHTGVYYSIMQPYFFFESIAQWLNSSRNKDDIMKSLQILMVGTNEAGLMPMIEKLGLGECVRFIPRVSHEKALSYAKSAHLLLVNLGFGDKDNAKGWIPLKLYDYLGCRRPVLAIVPEGGAASRLIQQTKSGHVVSSPDNKAVADIVERYYSAYKDKSPENGFHPDDSQLNNFDATTITGELANIFSTGLIRS